jgi:hypothetical protein
MPRLKYNRQTINIQHFIIGDKYGFRKYNAVSYKKSIPIPSCMVGANLSAVSDLSGLVTFNSSRQFEALKHRPHPTDIRCSGNVDSELNIDKGSDCDRRPVLVKKCSFRFS